VSKDEGYRKISADETGEFAKEFLIEEVAPDPDPNKKTPDQIKQDLKHTRRKTGRTTLLYRQVKFNTDLTVLLIIMSCFSLLGYFVAIFKMGVIEEVIEVGVVDFIKIVVALVSGLLAVLWKLHIPQGKLTRRLSSKANKQEHEVDDWGRTHYGKN